MKRLLVTVLALWATTAFAASPEDAYIAVRDAYVKKLNPPGDPISPTEAQSKEEERARADLERQMRSIVGPPNVKGFSGTGSFNVGSLFNGDMESGVLDGLSFTAPNDRTLLVTTVNLFERWVRTKEWSRLDGAVPSQPAGALAMEAFYTQAVSIGAAVSTFGELPVAKPASATAVHAMIAVRRQDIGPTAPSEIIVGVIAPPRVYIVSAPLAVKVSLMPPCEKVWKDALAKSEKLFEAYQASGLKDTKLMDAHSQAQDKGDADMRKCFAARIKDRPAFARLTQQAQQMVDSTTGK